ncbi:hypothetical protein [Nocardia vulneris]|uniref:Uncharacterized protein n=1 Tax=Nocardia vulneris TaxID=1141657 RepID=A0ABR4ZH18_9NOCA|nr:hypothetical protein [Nocardia vulneris]KIA64382.1 hypothetical protein FG87_14140 [Nocardia vulneris]
MRSLSGLRRRPAAAPARTDNAVPATTYLDPNVDPPIVAALVRPLLQLRSTLGSGVAVPNQTATAALSAASTQAADTEGPHRDGLHALESTWTSRGADAAVPALRTTQTEIGEISDRGPAYLSVLGDAHATSARAARTVDQIIADFRSDARQILGNATAAPDTDAVIARATQALRDALTTVNAAQTEMDDHSRRLDAMGPLTVTQPSGVTTAQPYSSGPYSSGTYPPGVTSQYVPGTTANGQPMDPALAAQLQLQQQLISAGVQVGTAAINAGVDIGTNIIDKIAGVGTHIIDKVAEVGTHAIDTVAAGADKAVTEAIRPGSTTGDGPNGSSNSSASPKLFDFGAGARTPAPSGPSGPSSVIPPSGPGSAPTANEAPPKPESKPAPAPAPAPPVVDDAPSRSAAPDQPHPPGTTGGVALPPSPPPDDREHKPREGQLGVTVPTAVVAVTPVLGDYDDDTL